MNTASLLDEIAKYEISTYHPIDVKGDMGAGFRKVLAFRHVQKFHLRLHHLQENCPGIDRLASDLESSYDNGDDNRGLMFPQLKDLAIRHDPRLANPDQDGPNQMIRAIAIGSRLRRICVRFFGASASLTVREHEVIRDILNSPSHTQTITYHNVKYEDLPCVPVQQLQICFATNYWAHTSAYDFAGLMRVASMWINHVAAIITTDIKDYCEDN